MPRTFAGFVPPLLAALALAVLSPGRVVAGPPEGASGKMVFDEVADGLRKCRAEMNVDRKAAWLKRLAPSQDPRVGVVLGEALKDRSEAARELAAWLLMEHYQTGIVTNRFQREAEDWWKENEVDLRRRAAQLPR